MKPSTKEGVGVFTLNDIKKGELVDDPDDSVFIPFGQETKDRKSVV